MGAPKATETPAADAADKISRFFASFRPYFGKRYAWNEKDINVLLDCYERIEL